MCKQKEQDAWRRVGDAEPRVVFPVASETEAAFFKSPPPPPQLQLPQSLTLGFPAPNSLPSVSHFLLILLSPCTTLVYLDMFHYKTKGQENKHVLLTS